MNFKKKLSILLTTFDVTVIIFVVMIKSHSTLNIDTKETKTAANVLINSSSALDKYKNEEIQQYINSRPVIVYDNMTIEQLSAKLDRVLKSTMSGKGSLIASYSLEKGVDPYLATAIILLETGCNSKCSKMVNICNNVGGQKGSGCGSYQAFPTLDDGIMSFVDNLNKNYFNKGLTTPETIGPKYAASPKWSFKVNNYISKIKKA